MSTQPPEQTEAEQAIEELRTDLVSILRDRDANYNTEGLLNAADEILKAAIRNEQDIAKNQRRFE